MTTGKQSVYVIKQDDKDILGEAEFAEMDALINSLKQEIALAKEDVKKLSAGAIVALIGLISAAHTNLSRTLSTSELKLRIEDLDKEVHSFEY